MHDLDDGQYLFMLLILFGLAIYCSIRHCLGTLFNFTDMSLYIRLFRYLGNRHVAEIVRFGHVIQVGIVEVNLT